MGCLCQLVLLNSGLSAPGTMGTVRLEEFFRVYNAECSLSVGGEVGRGAGEEVADKVGHFFGREGLSHRDGHLAGQLERQVMVYGFGGIGLSRSGIAQERLHEGRGREAFGAEGMGEHGVGASTQGGEVKADGLEVGQEGLERGSLGGGELQHFGKEQALRGCVVLRKLSAVFFV